MDFTIKYVRLSEISPDGHIDGISDFTVDPLYLKMLTENPFREGGDVVVLKLGIIDGKVGGSEYVFPLQLRCEGTVATAGGGSLTTVAKWARKSGLGLEISAMREDRSDGDFDVGVAAGLSQIAVRIHEYLKCPVFQYPRFVMLLKSRSLVEMRLKGALGRAVAFVGDCCIGCYASLVGCFARICTVGVRSVPVDPNSQEHMRQLAELADDGSSFSELHDERWFHWVLTNTLSKDGPPSAYLIYKGISPLAFFMTKRRFHEQASHRGFKNVWLGSIVEWGCRPCTMRTLLWVIVGFVLKARRDFDAFEFPIAETHGRRFLSRLGWRHVGEANFCYKVRQGSAFEPSARIMDMMSWRLRLGMGDAAFN